MRKVLLISPHFDDAVLSAGQLLAGRPNADVVTVFGGFPKDKGKKTPYDEKCGFFNAKEAVKARRREDDEALALLRANPIHLEYPDEQYGEPINHERLYEQICEIVHEGDYEFIAAPLGLGHPDHLLVSNIVWEANKNEAWQTPLYFWEDLPLRVVEPELVFQRLRHFNLTERPFIGDGPIAKKIRSLSCYKSQIGTGILDPYLMYVPERFWKV